MKILFLSQRFLLPMDAGGKIRTGKILEQLSDMEDITIVSNTESPKDDKYLPEIKKFCSKFIAVPWKETEKYSISFFFRLFLQMFSIYPVSVLNSCSNDLRSAIETELKKEKYDIAICDFILSAPAFENVHGIPLVVFQHNVESVIVKRHMKQSKNFLMKLFWGLQWKKMHAFEAKACRKFDTVIAVSDNDKDGFEKNYRLDNVVTIPTGVDVDYFRPFPDISVQKNNVAFCGSMDWLPNEDAMLYFIKEIIPLIKRKNIDISLTIIGKNPSPVLSKTIKDFPEVELTGWVDDTRPYLAQSALVIVPLRIGGGTRMKIYEAMAMGKTVVSTSIGAEGLPVKHGENIILADGPGAFAEHIITLLNDESTKEQIGKKARRFVKENFAWNNIADKFRYICEATLHEITGKSL
jgi:glycosyltransferase involved in cell wall biosynthesis